MMIPGGKIEDIYVSYAFAFVCSILGNCFARHFIFCSFEKVLDDILNEECRIMNSERCVVRKP